MKANYEILILSVMGFVREIMRLTNIFIHGGIIKIQEVFEAFSKSEEFQKLLKWL